MDYCIIIVLNSSTHKLSKSKLVVGNVVRVTVVLFRNVYHVPMSSKGMSNVHVAASSYPLNLSKGPTTTFTSPANSRTHLQSGDLTVQNRLAAVPMTLQEVVIIHVNIQKDQHSLGLSIIGGKVGLLVNSVYTCYRI